MGALEAIAGDRHDNNFDFFRLMAAIFVVFYHSFALTGREQYNFFALMGVSVFFIVSGYFITLSWCRHPSFAAFAWNRFLRLVPALTLVIAFTILVIGPLATELPLADYLTSGKTWLYALNIPLLSPVFKLPDVFVHNAYPFEANGSIWTLQLEARMYVAVVLLGVMGLPGRKRHVLLMTCVAALVFLTYYDIGVRPQVLAGLIRLPFLLMPMLDYRLPMFYSLLFMAGSLLYLYRDVIVYRPSVLATMGLLWVLSSYTQYFYTATICCLPYIVTYLGFAKLPVIKRITGHGDLSYGLYIFAFPVQQAIVHFFPTVGPWHLFGLSLPITLVLAALSWNLVESKALRLKGRDPWHLFKKAAQAPVAIVQNCRGR